MTDTDEARVAVYIDFDNIVISHYDHEHGRNAFSRDRARETDADGEPSAAMAERLDAATVDVGAIIDFASSYGTIVLTRAYADWSAPVNSRYQRQLVGRAVDLVQLFPAAAYAKNGADIRLAVDAVEDMFRLPDLTHVVIVAGDSDYVPLAQRCKRLGRYVVGVGVAGSTSRSLGAACDELITYGALPGLTAGPDEPDEPEPEPERPTAAATAPDEPGTAGRRGGGSGRAPTTA
uniref:NYN domain-containing protein n=1 Tax=Desertihabitans aurantiacus TaxID=2282477 RepID=UPI0013005A1F